MLISSIQSSRLLISEVKLPHSFRYCFKRSSTAAAFSGFILRKASDASFANGEIRLTCFLNSVRIPALSISLDEMPTMESIQDDAEGFWPHVFNRRDRIGVIAAVEPKPNFPVIKAVILDWSVSRISGAGRIKSVPTCEYFC
ncbi:unnamed protein product [Pseudo-nitzschia multistriata]|uniref:Uncharacterized protein n=1 Tax=Pseudo-nitzschia multistriata TaxID=183589 RepID=A0A448Z212_9STRA|nr:unnamed protein product [Pseudo-nitzschia multistriata]